MHTLARKASIKKNLGTATIKKTIYFTYSQGIFCGGEISHLKMRHNKIHKLIYIQKRELVSTLKIISVRYLDIQI